MEEKKQQKSSSREYQIFALKIIGDFGASIAVPVVAFVLLGQYLDKRYNLLPLFTILGFVVSALISGRIVYKKAYAYGAEYKKLGEKKD